LYARRVIMSPPACQTISRHIISLPACQSVHASMGRIANTSKNSVTFFGRALLPENELEHSSVTTIRQKCSQRSTVQWTFAKVRGNSHARNPLVGHRCECCWLMVVLSGLRLLGICGLLHALPGVAQRRRYLLPHVSSMLQINDPTCTTT
jgi:hypothetical protein